MKVLSREETKAIFKPENIIGQLVNADAGWNRLFDVPHRKFLRMYIVYHLNVSSIRHESKILDTIVIDNDIMHRMGMTENDLYSAAVINIGKPYIANTTEFLQLDPDVYDPIGDNLLIISNTRITLLESTRMWIQDWFRFHIMKPSIFIRITMEP